MQDRPVDMGALVRFAEDLADEAGAIARRFFRTDLHVQTKADRSPVTLADQAIETRLRGLIAERFPDHGILGEEHGTVGQDRALLWVLDPIDGTKSFISGMPTFGTLIALVRGGRPVLGVLDMPALAERWVGVAGAATRLNGAPCRVRACRGLAEAIVYTTSPDTFADPADGASFDRVSRRARLRRYGGDCYAYALLASGWVDVVIEAGLHPYDYMALIPVVEGAGGVVTDWAGHALGLAGDGRVVAAATADLHREVIAVLNDRAATDR